VKERLWEFMYSTSLGYVLSTLAQTVALLLVFLWWICTCCAGYGPYCIRFIL